MAIEDFDKDKYFNEDGTLKKGWTLPKFKKLDNDEQWDIFQGTGSLPHAEMKNLYRNPSDDEDKKYNSAFRRFIDWFKDEGMNNTPR